MILPYALGARVMSLLRTARCCKDRKRKTQEQDGVCVHRSIARMHPDMYMSLF